MTAMIDTLRTSHPQHQGARAGGARVAEAAADTAPGIEACAAALWAPEGGPWGIPPMAPSAAGRFRAVTDRLREVVERRDRQLAARTRLRRLVEDVDMVIAACEHAHLARTHQVTGELVSMAREVWDEAGTVFGELGDRGAQQLVERVSSARAIWVHELMDRLWAVQDAAFDLLVPWRRRLRDSERDGEEEAPWSDGVRA
jgi:hypothetical protein